ncbi:MAG TPA: hypothetical protein VMT46_09765 [Anaerolineaceae bacterium]|nr:hypothetical protein [Anaerolineaceae bacterium]
MFRKNQRHLQPALISNVNDLPDKLRQRLEHSWAGVFRREFFQRLKEEPFAVLYADVPSRPNLPVNVLVGLDTLKAGFGWRDEEVYAAFCFENITDQQVVAFKVRTGMQRMDSTQVASNTTGPGGAPTYLSHALESRSSPLPRATRSLSGRTGRAIPVSHQGQASH